MFLRRHLLRVAAGAVTLSALARLGLAKLLPTPPQTAGPFYPVRLPPDASNDLVRVGAKGIVTHIGGRVLNESERPVAGATVEIWQCDANGRYHHVDDGRDGPPRDDKFDGYGRTLTDAAGGYRFRTIRPVPYPGRTPHIHFLVSGPGMPQLVTQMYVAGDPGNQRDGVLLGIGDAAARARVIVTLRPAPEIEANALTGTFDIVLGRSL